MTTEEKTEYMEVDLKQNLVQMLMTLQTLPIFLVLLALRGHPQGPEPVLLAQSLGEWSRTELRGDLTAGFS